MVIYLDNIGLVSLRTLWLGGDENGSNLCSTSSLLSPSPSSSSLLEYLEIYNCGKLTSLGKGLLQLQHYLTALQSMQISNCPELADFPSGGLRQLRVIEYLTIVDCPKLQVAPDLKTADGNDENFLPPWLRKLRIEGCAKLVRSKPTFLKGLVSIDELTLKDCRELRSLEGLMGLQRIGCLEIRGCPKLVDMADTVGSDFTLGVDCLMTDDPSLPLAVGVLRNSILVQMLEILDCSQIESIDGQLEQWLVQNQTTLKRLRICGAASLKSLSDGLKNLSSLQLLVLTGVRELESLPKMPSSLKTLQVIGASETLLEQCTQDEGADWPNIKQIPDVIIWSVSDWELRYKM